MATAKKSVPIPPKFAAYAEKHEVFQLFEELMKSVIVDRPKDPLVYIADYLKKNPILKVIVYGPPAAGKTSLCRAITTKTGAVHVSLAELLNECETATTAIAEQIKPHLKDRTSIPDDLLLVLVVKRLRKDDCKDKGWLLSGFPNTRKQALALQTAGVLATHFVQLEAGHDVVQQRSTGRQVDASTGAPEGAETVAEGPTDIVSFSHYQEHAAGVSQCYSTMVRMVNADQPKEDIFDQVWSHLCTKSRSNAPFIPRVLLLGPYGSGRTSHAESLCTKYSCVHVALDRLVEKAIRAETVAGVLARNAKQDGGDIPDKVLISILAERLSEADCATQGWILDGFPQTRAQAEMLGKAGFDVNRAFVLNATMETLKDRVCQRRYDSQTGEAYHLHYRPPKDQEVMDRLVQRPEDKEQVVEALVQQFCDHIEDVIDLYPFAQRINADQPAGTVFECIDSVLVQPLSEQPQI